MQDVLGLILGGGRGTRLYPLTKHRSEPAVPVAGKYRLIDIPISNCLHSGCRRLYVFTQFLSVSLHRHLAATYKFGPFARGFVEVLPAQQTYEGADWYEGTADALRQHLRYLEEDPADDLLVLYSDQLYRMDFRDLRRTHRDSRADVTLAVLPVERAQAVHLGVAHVDEGWRITDLVEKPQAERQLEALRLPAERLPAGAAGAGKHLLGNMGIYLCRREVLLEMLREYPAADDLVTELIAHNLGRYRVQAHLFTGYWADLGSIRSYHEANLTLAGANPPFDFASPEGVMYTRGRNLPASRISAARVEDSLLSDGCTVLPGTHLTRCVVGVRTCIGRNVTLRDTVINGADYLETAADRAENRRQGVPDFGVGDGAVIERAILDRDCRIGRDVRIVNAQGVREADGPFYAIREGIVVIPDGAIVPDGTVI